MNLLIILLLIYPENLFNPVAEKYAYKQLADLKERARIMEEAGYKLPEGLQQGGQVSQSNPSSKKVFDYIRSSK